MMYSKKIIMFVVSVIVVLYSVNGCSSWTKDDKHEEKADGYKPVVEAAVTITLPENATVELNQTELFAFDKVAAVDVNGTGSIQVYTDRMSEVSLFLPESICQSKDVIYMTSTVPPGTASIKMSAEETAVSLVMNGLDHHYFDQSGIGNYVKRIIQQNSTAFIDDLTSHLESDPCWLRQENYDVVFGPLFAQAVNDSYSVLKKTFDDNASNSTSQSSAARISSVPRLATTTQTGSFISATIKPSEIQPGIAIEQSLNDSNGFTLYNFSHLPVLYKITLTKDGDVIHPLPSGSMTKVAFSSDILSPTSGPFNLRLPSDKDITIGSNVKLDIYTPGRNNLDGYNESGSPSTALLMRSVYSYGIVPIVLSVIPNAVVSTVFDFFNNEGVFDDLPGYWMEGDIGGAWTSIKNRLTRSFLTSFVNSLTAYVLDHPGKIVEQLGIKFASSEFALATAAVSVVDLAVHSAIFPSRTTFYITFPIGLDKVTPLAMLKVPEDGSNDEVFTLYGKGLGPVTFEGDVYKPRINLVAYNRENEELSNIWLYPNELELDEKGEWIRFHLPDAMVKTDTSIDHIVPFVEHHYIDVGWLGSITDYFNESILVVLPSTSMNKKRFTIDLKTDLIIKSTAPEYVTVGSGERLSIYGEGFASEDSGLRNRVFFRGKGATPLTEASTFYTSNSTFIVLKAPLTLDLDYYKIGESLMFVELEDGSRSNEVVVRYKPRTVIIEPKAEDDHYKDTLVTIKNSDSIPTLIYYSLEGDGGHDHVYTGPFKIQKSTTLRAYAVKEINGTEYKSDAVTAHYNRCQEGETYIPYPHGAKCVVIKNQDLIPTRYCPIDAAAYNALGLTQIPMSLTSNDFATCGYASFYGDVHIKSEYHYTHVWDDATNTMKPVLFENMFYWDVPVGRPWVIQKPGTDTIYVKPDGTLL